MGGASQHGGGGKSGQGGRSLGEITHSPSSFAAEPALCEPFCAALKGICVICAWAALITDNGKIDPAQFAPEIRAFAPAGRPILISRNLCCGAVDDGACRDRRVMAVADRGFSSFCPKNARKMPGRIMHVLHTHNWTN
jgi:hypothetical protein